MDFIAFPLSLANLTQRPDGRGSAPKGQNLNSPGWSLRNPGLVEDGLSSPNGGELSQPLLLYLFAPFGDGGFRVLTQGSASSTLGYSNFAPSGQNTRL
jgi:hypothetical protein